MRRISLLGLLVLVLAAGCQGDPQTQLEQAVKRLSKDLPKQIDPSTTLVEIQAADREVIYIYQVHGVSDEEVRQAEQLIKQGAQSAMAGKKKELRFYVDNKMPMTYVYRNMQGEELMRYSLHPWEL